MEALERLRRVEKQQQKELAKIDSRLSKVSSQIQVMTKLASYSKLQKSPNCFALTLPYSRFHLWEFNIATHQTKKVTVRKPRLSTYPLGIFVSIEGVLYSKTFSFRKNQFLRFDRNGYMTRLATSTWKCTTLSAHRASIVMSHNSSLSGYSIERDKWTQKGSLLSQSAAHTVLVQKDILFAFSSSWPSFRLERASLSIGKSEAISIAHFLPMRPQVVSAYGNEVVVF